MRRRSMLFPTILLAAGLALAACGGADDTGRGEGVVRGVDREAAQITIDHGEIPGVMRAMTMTFAVSDPALLEDVAVGDRVAFRVRYADGAYTVMTLQPK